MANMLNMASRWGDALNHCATPQYEQLGGMNSQAVAPTDGESPHIAALLPNGEYG